jgi:hypothetical protein
MRKNQESMSPNTPPVRSERVVASAGSNGQIADTIRERAYHLYEARMSSNGFGDPESDWLQAEQQVRTEYAKDKDILA